MDKHPAASSGLFYFAFDPFDHFIRHVASLRSSQQFSPMAPAEQQQQQKARTDARPTGAPVGKASVVEQRRSTPQQIAVLHFAPTSSGTAKPSAHRRGAAPPQQQQQHVHRSYAMESPRGGEQGAAGADEELPLDARHELRSIPVVVALAATSSRRSTGNRASSASPSPELVVAEEDNADYAKRFAPQLDPNSERLARIANEKRLALLRQEGHLTNTAPAASNDVGAPPTAHATSASASNEEQPLPRWLVLHHLAAQTSQKRAEARVSRELERDEQEAAELQHMQRERARLREVLIRRSQAASTSAHHHPRGATSATVSSGNITPGGRTRSPGSATAEVAEEIHPLSPATAGGADRPVKKPGDVADILAARLETNVLVPLRGSHGNRPSSDGDMLFSRKVSGASCAASDGGGGKHRRIKVASVSNGDATEGEIRQNETEETATKETASPSPKRPTSANATSCKQQPAAGDAAGHVAHNATKMTYRKQVMVEETFSFQPQITRGPRSTYYESRGLVERVVHSKHQPESVPESNAADTAVHLPPASTASTDERNGEAALESGTAAHLEQPEALKRAQESASFTGNRPLTNGSASDTSTAHVSTVVAPAAAPPLPAAADESVKATSSIGRFSTDRGVSPPSSHSLFGGDNDELQQVFHQHPQQARLR